jgi:CheY-like chemotaxis protein
MYRLLLIDPNTTDAERLAAYLRRRGLAVTTKASIEEAVSELWRRTLSYQLVVVIAPGLPEHWLAVLRRLKWSCRRSYLFHSPLFLFVSNRKCNPHLRLRIERMGARYVRER